MNKKSSFTLAAILIALLSVLSFNFVSPACAAVDQKTVAKVGTIVVGTDGTYVPFNYMDSQNKLIGFEIDMINDIAKRTGFKVEYRPLPWDGIFGQMESKKIDTIACCIFPSKERQKKYDFSREYIYDVNRIIVRKGDGSKYKTFKDLKGLKIGCAAGGNTILRLEELQKKVNFKVVAYNEERHVYDLGMKRLDAIYKSPVSAFLQAKQAGFEIEVADCPAIEEGSCALPWRKNDERSALIRKEFSKATQDMINDGTMKKLCNKWLHLDVTAYKPLFDFSK